MMRNKKGIELSINMLVVIILGIVILGAGLSIFYKSVHDVGAFRDKVDSQTSARLDALLDDGSPIVILRNNLDGKRGEGVTFSMAINNNLLSTKQFTVHTSYAGTTANYSDIAGGDPFHPSNAVQGYHCTTMGPEHCGNLWILGGERHLTMDNNAREHFPIQITIPKKDIRRGQYIFNVDVCMDDDTETNPECKFDETQQLTNRFSSRQKVYVAIN